MHDDVYCNIEITVDAKKHVKPVEVRPVAAPAKGPLKEIATDDKFVTIVKYSYYESGSKWVKVLLDGFKDIKNHPKDKVHIEFKPRSLTLRIMDFNGKNYQFQVPKLQCHIKPEECSLTQKSDSI
jgi:CS domain